MTIRLSYILTLLLALAVLSCHKDKGDDISPTPGGEDTACTWKATVTLGADDYGDVIFAPKASFERIKVAISGYNPDTDGDVIVASGASWLVLNTDTLAADHIVSIVTSDNKDDRRRTASIRFSSALIPSKNAEVEVTQLSSSDGDSNGGTAESVCYVGYGYDIFKAYESPMSVKKTKAVIDLEKLSQTADMLGFDPVQDCHLARTENKYFCNSTLFGFAEELTSSQTKSTMTLNGCREDCKRLEQRCQGNIMEHNLGRGSIVKSVASKCADRGALLELQKQGEILQSPYVVPWSDDFAMRVADLVINADNQTELQNTVERIINEYGTHVVIQTDLGGRIDYSFTMSKQSSANTIQALREEIDYTFGRIQSSERSQDLASTPSSSKNDGMAITIRGGGRVERETLLNSIGGLGNNSQLNIDDINRWIGSINPDINAPVSITDALDVVHFELIPIWELLPSEFRNIFLNTVLAMTEESDNKFDAEKLHIDLYSLDLSQKDLTDFSPDGSLCKILYLDDVPILEICSEYVPKIRTDRRVTVIYPIYQNVIKMTQGIFIGDGYNQPATVGFSDAYCYVNPIDTLPMGRILDKVYYIGGNLMFETYGINPIPDYKRNRVVQDDGVYLKLKKTSEKYNHPIVKIGSSFWTRHDIPHAMKFAAASDTSNLRDLLVKEQMKDDILYTRFQHKTGHGFNKFNSWICWEDYVQLDSRQYNRKWFIPQQWQVECLYEYIGFNTKALFKGGLSGFDAQFNGFVGKYDIFNNNSAYSTANGLHYKGDYCIIASINDGNENYACLLALDTDYKLRLYNDNTFSGEQAKGWRNNYYPVRLARTAFFKYPNLSTINNLF